MAGVTHRHVAGRVEDSQVRQDATGRGEIFEGYFHGITDTWIAPGAPSPPTDLMA